MTKIYDQFDAATRSISAYAVMKDDVMVGRVVFKYPRDGAGRLYAYIQVWGYAMVRGHAGGYGYDKHSAAVEVAANLLNCGDDDSDKNAKQHLNAWKTALAKCEGIGWESKLRDTGFEVRSVI